MRWLVAGILLLSLDVSLGWADHPGAEIDPRFATPGLWLELAELPAVNAQSTKRYRLRAGGFPDGTLVDVYTKHFDRSFTKIAEGFTLDRSAGDLVTNERGRLQRLGDIVLEPGPYLRGARWEVAVVSADRKLFAFAKVVPIPIRARDGSCVLSMELVSKRGLRFLVSAEGFPPGDEVVSELTYGGRSIHQRRRAAGDGHITPYVVSHGSAEADRIAHYGIRAKGCAVAVDYEWGDAALVAR